MNKEIIFPIESELLHPDELSKLTGRMAGRRQVEWLTENNWKFSLSGVGTPIVGTWYARMKLAGIEPSELLRITMSDFTSLTQKDK